MENLHLTQIHESEKELLQAMRQGDIEKLETLIHDDVLFILPSGQAITKEMDLAVYRSGDFSLLEIKADIEQINIIGDTAVATIVKELRGSMSGQEFSGRFRYIRIWKKTENQWQVIGGSGIQIGHSM